MDSRERFRQTMGYGGPDRVPCFHEGVEGWKRFTEVMVLTLRDPEFVRECMRIQGEFAALMAERALKDAEFDAAVFTEPIAENRGPLISPKMYEDLVLKSYEPVLAVLRRYRVDTIILLTFADIRPLLPSIVKWGFNCLWACEVPEKDMDYRDLRREFGRDLRLIGGIDLDVLRLNKESIKREVYEKVPPLLADGGFVPLADGRVRKDIPLDNYLYYRRLFEEVTRTGRQSFLDSRPFQEREIKTNKIGTISHFERFFIYSASPNKAQLMMTE